MSIQQKIQAAAKRVEATTDPARAAFEARIDRARKTLSRLKAMPRKDYEHQMNIKHASQKLSALLREYSEKFGGKPGLLASTYEAAAQRVQAYGRRGEPYKSLWEDSPWWPKELEDRSDDPKKVAFFRMCRSLPWGGWDSSNPPSGMDGVYMLEDALSDRIDEEVKLEDIKNEFTEVFNVVEATGSKIAETFDKIQDYYNRKIWVENSVVAPEVALAKLRKTKLPEIAFGSVRLAVQYTEDGLHCVDPTTSRPDLSDDTRLTPRGFFDFEVEANRYVDCAMNFIAEYFGGPMEFLLDIPKVKVLSKPFVITPEGEIELVGG